MKQLESALQAECVKWFRLQYPGYAGVFFSVPNGGMRNRGTAIRMKREGLLPGVSDLILLVPRGEYHGLCIEMKHGKGRQTKHQKAFEEAVESQGYRYVVVGGFLEFAREIQWYLTS